MNIDDIDDKITLLNNYPNITRRDINRVLLAVNLNVNAAKAVLLNQRFNAHSKDSFGKVLLEQSSNSSGGTRIEPSEKNSRQRVRDFINEKVNDEKISYQLEASLHSYAVIVGEALKKKSWSDQVPIYRARLMWLLNMLRINKTKVLYMVEMCPYMIPYMHADEFKGIPSEKNTLMCKRGVYGYLLC